MIDHMYTLITRGKIDAVLLASELKSLGIKSILDPLLEVNFIKGPRLILDDIQLLLMTSANGVRAFARRSVVRDIPVCAVGDATARTAYEYGFTSIQSAEGNVEDLANLVLCSVSPSKGSIFHTTGTYLAGNLGLALAKNKFNYRRHILYETVEAYEFSNKTLEAFSKGYIISVMLYSPRTAIVFANLVKLARIEACLYGVIAFCLSDAVAQNISKLKWKKVLVSQIPDQASLLTLVRQSS